MLINNDKQKKDFYTTAELAKLLGVSRITVFNRIKEGVIKAQKISRNFVVFKNDLGDVEFTTSSLTKNAWDWVILQKEFSKELYCQNSAVFQDRLMKMEAMMLKNKDAKGLYSILTSVAGEIGNNSFDHNIGQWPDIPGIYFGYDLIKKQIVLADRGVGVLKTLKRVRPKIDDHKEALRVAFSEIVSGREPEARGNGLKYVRKVILKNSISLLFQAGDAKLKIDSDHSDLNIENTEQSIQGCLAVISY